MSYQDEYDKTHRVVTINDYGNEVTVRTGPGDTSWSGLVELAINAIRGLGYCGVQRGDAVVEAIEFLRAEEEASKGETIPLEDLDPEVDSAAR